jgi:hypothetical protein
VTRRTQISTLMRTSWNQNQISLGNQETRGSVADGKPLHRDDLILFRLGIFNFLYSGSPNDEVFFPLSGQIL